MLGPISTQQESLFSSYHFKARDFDPNIVRCNGILGVPLIQRKHPTVPKEFHFKYDERAEVHKQKDVSMMVSDFKGVVSVTRSVIGPLKDCEQERQASLIVICSKLDSKSTAPQITK